MFYVSVVVAALGAAALVLVSCFWRYVTPYYRDTPAKLGVAVFRAIAAVAALTSKFTPSPNPSQIPDVIPPLSVVDFLSQHGVASCLTAILGYLAWEVTGIIGDVRWKAAKERTTAEQDAEVSALTSERDDAILSYDRLARLVSHARTLTVIKLRRIRGVVAGSQNTRAAVSTIRSALSPDTQVRAILESLALLFRTDVVRGRGKYDQNFRVGLYVEQSGRLVPLDAFNLNSRIPEPLSSHHIHADHFRLEAVTDHSHAVRCVLEDRTLIVADCASDETFRFFSESQASYLKSLVAYPIRQFCTDGDEFVRAAILVDTDVTGFFREEDREMVELRLKEFAARLELEYAIRRLVR